MNIKFNDVVYSVSTTTKLPIASPVINIPTPNIQKGMEIIIDMKETITKCEDLIISFQKSRGLGFNTDISIKLESIIDTATGSVVVGDTSAYIKVINSFLAELVKKSQQEKSMAIVIKKSNLTLYIGKTVYFSMKFSNQVTGEVQSIAKKVSIVSDVKLEILDQSLIISRTKATQISNVKYIS